MSNHEPPFSFRALQVFVATVEAGSVTRAAHRLGMSASSVSAQLAGLETALGTKLIERTARVFRLTRSGSLFIDPARKLLDDITAAKAQLVMAEEQPPLSLRIASIEELDATVTAPWLLRMADQLPNVTFSMTSGASHENHDALSSRAVDIMLAVDTVAEVDWVEQHAVLRDPFILVAAPCVTAQSLEDLTTVPFVRYASDLQIGRQIAAQLRRTGQQPARGYEFSSNQALFAMTAELGGWSITTALAYLGTARAHELLVPHPLPLPRFARRLALHARAGSLSALPRQIANELRGCLRDRILAESAAQLPFLNGDLEVLEDNPNLSF